jgi:hypothetical protein
MDQYAGSLERLLDLSARQEAEGLGDAPYVLNHLNRALGLPDGYPFVLSARAIDKMRFVHDTVGATSRPNQPGWTAAGVAR